MLNRQQLLRLIRHLGEAADVAGCEFLNDADLRRLYIRIRAQYIKRMNDRTRVALEAPARGVTAWSY